MKLERLLGIVVLLSQKETMTAPQLAEYFEVSRRTINRDIDSLCVAGIPIVTRQGNQGGIAIQEGYKLDKQVFNEFELSNIITGLKALNSVNQSVNIDLLLNKLVPNHIETEDVIKIELGSFYKDSLAEKISILKNAIHNSKKVTFTYYNASGESTKVVEPYYIVFKWSNWYVYAYCPKSETCKLYKLNRLWNIVITEETFEKKKIIFDMDQLDDIFVDKYALKAVFEQRAKYRLIDEYGINSFNEQDDGRLKFERHFTNYDYMMQWVLQFGDAVTVIEPQKLIIDLKSIAENIAKKYHFTQT